ncbi:threonine synthase [Rhodomicrobium udaipurense JA643]|uniref:Threonine synthase n=1 Tax=Rhodomicrobium udaipurense TaxID=1202716 RepID=A0A8I1G9W3_9HYPH|nr:threonine synthase [Rhodomicrobium udaipurense]KAI94405.1 threonine synthase [Rhodomicrobium udaipurense JA643]MBJ7543213.1 threonine synthase [Rhodomicrobium udaipurense]
MMYVSTRGAAPKADFEEALLAGLAPDGGLYIPETWPQLSSLPASPTGAYAAAAAHVMTPYMGGNPGEAELFALVSDAYARFADPDTAPLKTIGPDLYLLELFHGPTLAFKDFAMQVLSRLMERALKRRGQRTTIVGATSGDTGAAAVEAFRGRDDIELFILYPHGRISDVQRKQMTTATEDNIHAIAIEGTFDDTQAILKALFGDAEFRTRHALSAINSINWARIVAQTVYYYTAAAKLGTACRPSFAVPTGNFGDIFAGFASSLMGLSMGRLVIATNENDILARTLESGRYEPKGVVPTDSPSMDIQISSNFERLLFEESGRDADLVNRAMADLKAKGHFDLPPATLARIRERFTAWRVTREEAAEATRALFDETGMIIDPHTAVGVVAGKREQERSGGSMVVLSTAHPAKFPEAVTRATGRAADIPERLVERLQGRERVQVLPNSAAAVADVIARHAANRPQA